MYSTQTGRRQRAGRVLNPAQRAPLLRFEYDRGSSYEADTGVVAALDALVPEHQLIHPDHRFFQLVHLVTEYAWLGIHHELCRVVGALDAGDPGRADLVLRRCTGLADLSVRAARLFEETLSQASMLAMRDRFSPGASGLDSPGMRNLRRAARAVWAAFESAVAAAGVSLTDLTIHNGPLPAPPSSPHVALLAGVMDDLHRLDAKVSQWKQVHLSIVWMLLGGHPAATGAGGTPTSMRGRPVTDLERLAAAPLFPLLWRHSTEVYHNGLPAPAG